MGDVRKLIEHVCGCSIMLFGVGQRLVSDSSHLCQAGRLEEQPGGRYKLQVHALPLGDNAAPAGYPPSDLLCTAPDVKMAGDSNLIYMLLHLVDAPNATAEVQCLAYKTLARLQTWPEITKSLKTCCGELAPGMISDSIKQLLFMPLGNGMAVRPQPAALMYTLEALFALMEPANDQDRFSVTQEQAADNSQLRTTANDRAIPPLPETV
jgi:hypothetical protein